MQRGVSTNRSFSEEDGGLDWRWLAGGGKRRAVREYDNEVMEVTCR